MEGYLLVSSNGIHCAALTHTNVGTAGTGRDFKGTVGTDNRFAAELTLNAPCGGQYLSCCLDMTVKVASVNSHP